jgi:hypothetical protein
LTSIVLASLVANVGRSRMAERVEAQRSGRPQPRVSSAIAR